MKNKPEFVTFTGLDRWADHKKILELSKKYPIEWGVLFFGRERNRYPNCYFRNLLSDLSVKKSAHLCGGLLSTFNLVSGMEKV